MGDLRGSMRPVTPMEQTARDIISRHVDHYSGDLASTIVTALADARRSALFEASKVIDEKCTELGIDDEYACDIAGRVLGLAMDAQMRIPDTKFTPRIGDVLESKDGKRRTVTHIDTTGRLFVRTACGCGTIYPNSLHRYRVVRAADEVTK